MLRTSLSYVGNFRCTVMDTFPLIIVNNFRLCRGCVRVVVHRKLRLLLGDEILNYSVRYPYLHTFRLLHKETLVGHL